MRRASIVLRYGVLSSIVLAGCSQRSGSGTAWEGAVDTLPDGHVAIRNGDRGIWTPDSVWKVEEEFRIGAVASEGPENFGDIASIALDGLDRIWILDHQAAELRVFDSNGSYVRTVGRRGSGPGEFRQPVRVDISPDGRIWVMDPGNARISVFDSAGTYVEAIPTTSGFVMLPWPGGFDERGHYYAPVLRSGFHVDLARFNAAYEPIDTIEVPTNPVPREEFELVIDGRVQQDEPVPFQGSFVWRLSPTGTVWALVSDEYRLFELDPGGDTLSVITKTFTPIRIVNEERDSALDDLKPFIEMGGKVDPSRIPSYRPAVRSFFVDDHSDLWVERANPFGRADLRFDLFNPAGQYLGVVDIPFALRMTPAPLIRANVLWAVVTDTLDVQYVLRARIRRPNGR